MISKRLITSYGVGSWHPDGLLRMKKTLEKYSGFDIKLWSDDYLPGSPTHQDNPYAFKTWTLKWAKEAGYKTVLWLDAAVWANKDPVSVFEHVEKNGYLLLKNGDWNQGVWSTERQLEYYKQTREQAFQIQHPMACMFGISFDHEIGNEIFNRYLQAAIDGVFIGPWWNHEHEVSDDERVLGSRHDQTCLGYIAYDLNLSYDDNIVAYVKPYTNGKLSLVGDLDISDFVFHSQGGGSWPPV
jgi:hypothetical protein